jgi:hypothetical protein
MTPSALLNLRLHNQFVAGTAQDTPYDVVKGLVAVQAQDFLGSLWAVGLRMKKATEASIEEAIASRTIVRSWPMRGTLHFVAAEDLRWMLSLLTPRIVNRAAYHHRLSGLDEKIFAKCRKLIVKALEGGNLLTRDEVYDTFEKGKISTADQRGLHILGQLAHEGLICFGPRRGKQITFTLLDEWVPKPRKLDSDEALAELALRYFKSRGPATVNDFAWWSGLSLTEAKHGLEMAQPSLHHETIGDQDCWMAADTLNVKVRKEPVHLLSSYDEYLIAYTDRSAALNPQFNHRVMTGNGIFNPIIVVNGQVAGTWKRTIKKDTVTLDVKPLTPLSEAHRKALATKANRYGQFVGMEPKLVISR